MKRVEFYRTIDDGQETIGVAFLRGDKVSFKDLPTKLIEELRKGIRGKIQGHLFYPKDGVKFLEALKYAYSGSILRASDVME